MTAVDRVSTGTDYAARVRAAYARIAEVDRPEVWITLRPESDVLDETAQLEVRRGAGERLPLAGMLVAVKDNIDVAGLPTTAACPEFSYLPAMTAPAVQRLVDAGAVVLGKTNLDQFATGLVGTRSPYGAVRSATRPDHVSGGSSSGSAVAVALEVADIGVGTDTAGSGRVPAAFNGVVGLKPTLGLIPTVGVVPAARPYDCVSVFARTLGTAQLAARVMTGPAADDPTCRTWPADVPLAPRRRRVAVPDADGLAPCDERMREAVEVASAVLERAGYEIETVDIAPLLAVAELLYGSALVAERYAAVGRFLDSGPASADPVVAAIVTGGRDFAAHELCQAQDQVARARGAATTLFARVDALLLPTTTEHPTLSAVAADPLGVNARLGTYTNFVNLLDLAALAVPVAEDDDGPRGVTLVGSAFTDSVLLQLASELSGEPLRETLAPVAAELVVFGAHLRGQPLNHQLRELGARYLGDVRTASQYRMVALPTEPVKPGIVHDPADGAALLGERWGLSPAALGTFLSGLPYPMSLGRLTLEDGSACLGFLCDPVAAARGVDITAHGSWLAHLSR